MNKKEEAEVIKHLMETNRRYREKNEKLLNRLLELESELLKKHSATKIRLSLKEAN